MIQTNNSWLKLPRSFTSWRWYQDSNTVHAFLYLLLQANVKENHYKTLTILPGQLVTSLAKITEDTGLSSRNVRTCLRRLTETKDIKVSSNNKGTIVTITDFEQFQRPVVDDDSVGWIKLYRKIQDWNYYKETGMLHVFIHLLLNAVFIKSQDATLERGQLVMSKNAIRKDTGLSIGKVKTCLQKLESSGEIQIAKDHSSRTNLITVTKYSHYQAHACDLPLGNTYQQNFIQQNNLYVENAHFSQFLSNINVALNNCLTECYNNFFFQGDKQTTNHRQTNDLLPTSFRQAVDMQVPTPIEYNNEEREKISSTMRMGVCEDEFLKGAVMMEEKKPSKESYFEEVSKDVRWISAIKVRFDLKSEAKVMQMLQTFELEMLCLGKGSHKDMEDYKSHFFSWLNKQGSAQDQPSYGSKFTPRSTEGGTIYSGEF